MTAGPFLIKCPSASRDDSWSIPDKMPLSQQHVYKTKEEFFLKASKSHFIA